MKDFLAVAILLLDILVWGSGIIGALDALSGEMAKPLTPVQWGWLLLTCAIMMIGNMWIGWVWLEREGKRKEQPE